MMRAIFLLALVLSAALLPPVGRAEAEVGDIAFTRKTPGTDEIPPALFPHS